MYLYDNKVMLLRNKVFFIFLIIFIISSCGSKSSLSSNEADQSINIIISGAVSPSVSYYKQQIKVSSDNEDCTYNITSLTDNNADILHLNSVDKKVFTFRNPIIYSGQLDIEVLVETNVTATCPSGSKILQIQVKKYETKYDLNPININNLKSSFFQISDIGFDGIIIRDRYSANICYPTPNDCVYYENELFGQDAHNMIQGDFNGDGHEDFAVSWAFFPHTIEPSQKVNAPINIYLNNGNGRFQEDLSIYKSNSAPTHPFAYRTIAADFNSDGIDDIFAGSMGIQYRSSDYSENFIDPYPHMLLLSNADGKFEDRSFQLEDKNDGNGQLCNFAHDASIGDPDGDGDIDIFACNILNINNGYGIFTIHEYINLNWQRENMYGNPMSSLMTDLNNDGFDDILFWNFDNRDSWSDADEGYILLSNNSRNINEWSEVVLPVGPFGFNRNKYNHAAAGDINNDGFQDVVVAVTRDLPYYEGAYIQVLINDGTGKLLDVTDVNFLNQPRSINHHGEGNIYLRDMNLDGYVDIIHSTRDYSSGYHGAHIAINDGSGKFISIGNSDLPNRPDPGYNNYNFLMKSLPINIDDEACIDFISVTDVGWNNSEEETSNYFFSVLNIDCDF